MNSKVVFARCIIAIDDQDRELLFDPYRFIDQDSRSFCFITSSFTSRWCILKSWNNGNLKCQFTC